LAETAGHVAFIDESTISRGDAASAYVIAAVVCAAPQSADLRGATARLKPRASRKLHWHDLSRPRGRPPGYRAFRRHAITPHPRCIDSPRTHSRTRRSCAVVSRRRGWRCCNCAEGRRLVSRSPQPGDDCAIRPMTRETPGPVTAQELPGFTFSPDISGDEASVLRLVWDGGNCHNHRPCSERGWRLQSIS